MSRDFGDTPHGRASLAMVIVELAAIDTGLIIFAESCYTLEGDSCLVLRAKSVFERIEAVIDADFECDGLDQAVDRASPMMAAAESHVKANSDSAQATVSTLSDQLAKLKSELKELNDEKKGKTETTSTSRTGRASKKTSKAVDESAVEDIVERIVEKKLQIKDAMAKLKEAKEVAKVKA